MNTGNDHFTNGTEIFAMILNSDGLLSRDLLNKLFDNIDFGSWITKNLPSTVEAYNNMEGLMDETGTIVENNEDGEILKNAICQYVIWVFNIWKNSTPTKISSTQCR